MIDANVIYSAITLPNSLVGARVRHIKENHTLVLCEYIIQEVTETFITDRPNDLIEFLALLDLLADEIFVLNYVKEAKYPTIRDLDDLPVLINAIEANVDILITGDKDFDDVKIKRPRIMKPGQYEKEFMKI